MEENPGVLRVSVGGRSTEWEDSRVTFPIITISTILALFLDVVLIHASKYVSEMSTTEYKASYILTGHQDCGNDDHSHDRGDHLCEESHDHVEERDCDHHGEEIGDDQSHGFLHVLVHDRSRSAKKQMEVCGPTIIGQLVFKA